MGILQTASQCVCNFIPTLLQSPIQVASVTFLRAGGQIPALPPTVDPIMLFSQIQRASSGNCDGLCLPQSWLCLEERGCWLLLCNPSAVCRICIDFHWCWQQPSQETGRAGFGPLPQSLQTEVGISQEPNETVALAKNLSHHKSRDSAQCLYPVNTRTSFYLLSFSFPLTHLCSHFWETTSKMPQWKLLIVLAVSGS